MNRTQLTLAALSMSLSTAFGGQIPAVEPGTSIVTSRMSHDQLEFRDASNGMVLLASQGIPLLRDINRALTTNVVLQQQPSGADLVITLTNPTGEAKPAGMLNVGMFNLGPEIEYFDFRKLSLPVRAVANTFPSFAVQYPASTFSPVMVLRNQRVAVGVSIQYPVMEYKHDVIVGMCSPPESDALGPAQRGWLVNFGLSNTGGESVHTHLENPALIPPGQSRTYVISIRVTRNPAEWVTTMLPYRDYFRSIYGGVQYQRRTFPVQGMGIASVENLSASNPRGYDSRYRPDLNGWGPMVNAINQYRWSSTMIWALSGCYKINTFNNYPFLVASPLRDNPHLATAFDPTIGLNKAAENGRELGIWWGRSQQLSHNWDSPEQIKFDPQIPAHAALALREMQAMHDLGATVIGLDTFGHTITPIWKSIPWIRDMQARFPGVSFVTEPATCDIMNTIAANWVDGFLVAPGITPHTVDDLYMVKGPHILADLVIPGHETWTSLAYHLHTRYFNLNPNESYILNDVRRYASWGYVPIVFRDMDCPTDIHPANSWETSLPASIVANDPYISALRHGRLPNSPTQAPPSGGGSSGGLPTPPPPAPPTPPAPPSTPTAGTPPTPTPRIPTALMPGMGNRSAPVKKSKAGTGMAMVTVRPGPVSSAPPPPPSTTPRQPSNSPITVTNRFNRALQSMAKTPPPASRANRTTGILALIEQAEARAAANDDD